MHHIFFFFFGRGLLGLGRLRAVARSYYTPRQHSVICFTIARSPRQKSIRTRQMSAQSRKLIPGRSGGVSIVPLFLCSPAVIARRAATENVISGCESIEKREWSDNRDGRPPRLLCFSERLINFSPINFHFIHSHKNFVLAFFDKQTSGPILAWLNLQAVGARPSHEDAENSLPTEHSWAKCTRTHCNIANACLAPE